MIRLEFALFFPKNKREGPPKGLSPYIVPSTVYRSSQEGMHKPLSPSPKVEGFVSHLAPQIFEFCFRSFLLTVLVLFRDHR